MVDCKETKLRFRADQLYYAPIRVSDEPDILGYVCVQEGNDSDMVKDASKQANALLKELNRKGKSIQSFQFRELVEATPEEMKLIPSPASGKPTLTMPRDFNLMFQTQVGALADESATAYLRPETAQGIFLNFKNVLTTSRQKIPFGIAQIGKAFRNEITPEISYSAVGNSSKWRSSISSRPVMRFGAPFIKLGWTIHEPSLPIVWA